MREIKFRAWNENLAVPKSNEYMDYSDSYKNLSVFFGKNRNTDFCKCHIMQSTGLQDVSGKDIYEGDIVKLDKKIYYIFFDLGSFCMTQKFEYAIFPFTFAEFEAEEIEQIKVIGNIYENPELLEQGRVSNTRE